MNPEQVQLLLRAQTGTAGSFNEDWLAYCESLGITSGSFNERVLQAINQTMGWNHTNFAEAYQRFLVEGSFFSGPLDDFSSTPAIALSASHRLTRAWTGDAFDLREDAGDTVEGIGFLSDGTLNTTEAADHLNGASGFIPTWFTQVGAIDAVQATAASQPAYAATGLNGGPAFDFDGANHFFNVASLGVTMGGLFCVFHNDTIINAAAGPDHLLHSDTDNWVGFGAATSSLTNEIVSIATGGTNRVGWTSASDSIAVGVHSLAIRWTGSTYQIRVDGVERANATNGTPAKMTLSTPIIGSHSGTSRFFDGKLGDLIIFGGNPTVADAQAFEAWAAANRGVTLS